MWVSRSTINYFYSATCFWRFAFSAYNLNTYSAAYFAMNFTGVWARLSDRALILASKVSWLHLSDDNRDSKLRPRLRLPRLCSFPSFSWLSEKSVRFESAEPCRLRLRSENMRGRLVGVFDWERGLGSLIGRGYWRGLTSMLSLLGAGYGWLIVSLAGGPSVSGASCSVCCARGGAYRVHRYYTLLCKC